MAEPIPCPSCQTPIRLPAEFHLAWLTCPHCRAVVPNPVAQTVRPDTPRPQVVTGPAEAVPSPKQVPRCPHCDKPAQAEWLFCPHCEEPLRSPIRGANAGLLRDGSASSARRTALAILGGIGVALLFLFTASAFASGAAQPLLVFLISLIVLLAVCTLVVLVRNDGNVSGPALGRVLVNLLVVVGMFVLLAFLLSLAGIVFGMVVCMTGGRC
jgi:hypothetical protein